MQPKKGSQIAASRQKNISAVKMETAVTYWGLLYGERK